MQYSTELKKKAQNLRNNATKQEKRLWYEFLREFRPRFTRQRVIGCYIIDFYCAEAKLAIELDGSQHYEPDSIEYDRKRTEFLETLGIQVMRIANNEIDKNLAGVCDGIKEKTLGRQPPPSADGTPFHGSGLGTTGDDD